MPNLEHVPKQPAGHLKSASSPAKDQSSPAQGLMDFSSANLSSEALIQLQRTIGNHAVQRMLNRTSAIGQAPVLDNNDLKANSAASGSTIQRAITPLPGKSSGLFKGRRDKINALVVAYNALETETTQAVFSAAKYQKLIAEIQKIKTAAAAWQTSVATSKPDKAASIGTWITTEVDRESNAKYAQVGNNAEGRKAAYDNAAYNPLYATDAYKVSAGALWLQTPALAPIYKYFMIQQQEEPTLHAFEDMMAYRKNPNRAEALRIYNKYEMRGIDLLNITGEGAGGKAAIDEVRRQMNVLAASEVAPVPADFGAIEKSITYVTNSMFLTFSNTEPYKKVTTPPR